MTNPYYEYAEAPFAAAPSALLDFSVAETPDGNALYFFFIFRKSAALREFSRPEAAKEKGHANSFTRSILQSEPE